MYQLSQQQSESTNRFLNEFVMNTTLPLLKEKELKTGYQYIDLQGRQHSLWQDGAVPQYRPMKGFIPGLGLLMSYWKSCGSRQEQLFMEMFLPARFNLSLQLGIIHSIVDTEIWSSGRPTRTLDASYSYLLNFSVILKNAIKSLKAQIPKGKKVLLLGRDVWYFVPFFVRYNLPFIYDSRVSRKVARTEKFKYLTDELYCVEDGDIVFDTGFLGTIPHAVSETSKKKIQPVLLSSEKIGGYRATQVFPCLSLSRTIALNTEYLWKPFKSGTESSGMITQFITDGKGATRRGIVIDIRVLYASLQALMTIYLAVSEFPKHLRNTHLKNDLQGYI